MWLRRLCLAVAFLAVALLVASGPGVRFGLWSYATGFLLLRIAAYAGLGAGILAAVLLLTKRWRSKALVLALLVALVAAAVPFELLRRARSVPPINDISTALDTAPATAEQQRRAYPDIQPLMVEASPEAAFAKARAAAQEMGWDIVSANPVTGHIQAVATTFWFGFKDDVAVRITPQGGASRIDVRSKSRVGRGDAGTNARRTREYLKRLQ
jgi:uncharacterized protein (DUF1499 family)